MVRFIKAHACGNDFLIVDEPLEERSFSAVAQTLCAQHWHWRGWRRISYARR